VIDEDHYIYVSPHIYGISQNPNTKDYILVLENGNHCETCGEIYTLTYLNWCESCQINNLKINFKNWTSGNKIIDKFIQGMQLEFENHNDTIFEWISYNQFSDLKEISKNDSSILYSAIWKNGPLKYNQKEWERTSNKEVTLKCLLHNPQNITIKLLNEVQIFNFFVI
jgi:hypothetical protein